MRFLSFSIWESLLSENGEATESRIKKTRWVPMSKFTAKVSFLML
jgi:hypothetical protein